MRPVQEAESHVEAVTKMVEIPIHVYHGVDHVTFCVGHTFEVGDEVTEHVAPGPSVSHSLGLRSWAVRWTWRRLPKTRKSGEECVRRDLGNTEATQLPKGPRSQARSFVGFRELADGRTRGGHGR